VQKMQIGHAKGCTILGAEAVCGCAKENKKGGWVMRTWAVLVAFLTVAAGSYGNCWDPSECAGQRYGDATCDSVPSLADLFAIKAGFGKSAPWRGSYCCTDFNHDGTVDLADLFILKRYFGSGPYSPSTGNQQCPPDIDQNWHIGLSDYAFLAGDWRKCSAVEHLPGDTTWDGCVDENDLRVLVGSWLDCSVMPPAAPWPRHNDAVVDPNVTLSWSTWPGTFYHDVYLGTDSNAVADASRGWAEFMGTVAQASFDPCALELATTYHWRIDEVGPGCMTKGPVWTFTTWHEPDYYLAGWWEFDETEGTTAYDSTGSNHGTLEGDPNRVAGHVGSGALDFDGDGDYVEIPDDVSLNPAKKITISFWLYNRGGQEAGVYKYADHGGRSDRAYRLSVADGTGRARLFISSPNTWDSMWSTGTLGFNAWHHLAATFNEGHAAIYIDGQPDSSETLDTAVSSITNDVQPLIIGGHWDYYAGGEYFISCLNGIADDVRIYNRALNAEEIQRLYQQ
jgi:hypothetical protein